MGDNESALNRGRRTLSDNWHLRKGAMKYCIEQSVHKIKLDNDITKTQSPFRLISENIFLR